jgi:hypothetical protein
VIDTKPDEAARKLRSSSHACSFGGLAPATQWHRPPRVAPPTGSILLVVDELSCLTFFGTSPSSPLLRLSSPHRWASDLPRRFASSSPATCSSAPLHVFCVVVAYWLKASRPLIRVLVINDNHYGLTFLFES